jgi:hypothetical protein
MSITSLTNEILEKILLEIRKKENIEKIHSHVIDPLVNYTFQKIYPYVIITSIVFLLTFLIAIIILLLIIRNNFKFTTKII